MGNNQSTNVSDSDGSTTSTGTTSDTVPPKNSPRTQTQNASSFTPVTKTEMKLTEPKLQKLLEDSTILAKRTVSTSGMNDSESDETVQKLNNLTVRLASEVDKLQSAFYRLYLEVIYSDHAKWFANHNRQTSGFGLITSLWSLPSSSSSSSSSASLGNNARLRYGILAMVSVLLTIDYLYYGCLPVIEWRMRRKLRKCSLPRDIPQTKRTTIQPPVPIPVSYYYYGLPTVLIGPRNSGKTSALFDIARKSVANKSENGKPKERQPVIYINIPSDTTNPSRSSFDDLARMNTVAKHVYRQMGFPSRLPLVRLIYDSLRIGYYGLYSEKTIAIRQRQIAGRLGQSFAVLFSVCKDYHYENIQRHKITYKRHEDSVVLLLDDIYNLVLDQRLRNVGGRSIFQEISHSLIVHNTKYNRVSAVLAASSDHIDADTADGLHGNGRWGHAYMEEPSLSDLSMALYKKGYSITEVKQITDFCGTRIGLYNHFLTGNIGNIHIDRKIRYIEKETEEDFETFFNSLSTSEDRIVFADLCDYALKVETEGETNVKRVWLPRSLNHIDYSLILQSSRGHRPFRFTTKAHALTWSRIRWHYAGPKKLRSFWD